MKIKKLILLLTFSLISSGLFSQVKDSLLLNKVINQLKIKQEKINLDLAVDKILPFSANKSVLVIPKYHDTEKNQNHDDSFHLDAYIIIADNLTGKIINQYFEPNAWTSDAVMLSSIDIDTGLYNLNKETRAFGIRVNYTGSSKPNPYNYTDFSLYIIDKNKLKKVLKNFTTAEFQGECDTNCAGEFEDKNSEINVDKLGSKKLNDLVINFTTVKMKNTLINGKCVEHKSTKKKIKKLKFNGIEYK